MPKMKSHSGTKKRVKKTATGKLKVSHANRAHLKTAKSKSSIRKNRRPKYVETADAKRMKKQIQK